MILILGGVKSGKSSYALTLSLEYPKPRAFLATAEPFDAEMKQRIERHQESRGNDFELFEEPINLSGLLPKLNHKVILVDCLTVWIGNLYHYGLNAEKEIRHLTDSLTGREIIVSNEVGCGIIPESVLAREYAEKLAKLNQSIAQKAEKVYLMVAGIATRLK